MTIDEIIEMIRKQRSISREQLACELNISHTTINRRENVHRIPSRLAKIRLSEFCTEKDASEETTNSLSRISKE